MDWLELFPDLNLFPYEIDSIEDKDYRACKTCLLEVTEVGHCDLTCCTEEEGQDWHEAHVAHRRLKGECEHSEGDPCVLDGSLQRDRYYLQSEVEFTIQTSYKIVSYILPVVFPV